MAFKCSGVLAVTCLIAIETIIIFALYLALGLAGGDSEGNKLTICPPKNCGPGSKGSSDIQTSQSTSQGGFHIFENEGIVNVNWGTYMTLAIVGLVFIAQIFHWIIVRKCHVALPCCGGRRFCLDRGYDDSYRTSGTVIVSANTSHNISERRESMEIKGAV